jgi:hypothetical protein
MTLIRIDRRTPWLALILSLCIVPVRGGGEEPAMSPETFAGLKLRAIGPALMSGRITDIAVHPQDQSTWYVAAGSGNLWKTTNAGTTWDPDLRRPGFVLDRLRHARPEEPRDRLGRHGREPQRPPRRVR